MHSSMSALNQAGGDANKHTEKNSQSSLADDICMWKKLENLHRLGIPLIQNFVSQIRFQPFRETL